MEVDTNVGMQMSPYLTAIQSLHGSKPGEKYSQLNALVREIVVVCQETGKFIEVIESREIPAAILPLVRVMVGNELKLCEAVVEALKSSDSPVVNKALRAKWFFDGSNDFINVRHFTTDILPFVSLRTRLEIIKILSRSLRGAEGKAEQFFNAFLELYDLEQSLAFLPYCREEFIFRTILKYKIFLTIRMLNFTFQRYPALAIRYLHLGNRDNKDNVEARKIHSIHLPAYKSFLPKLIRHHVHEYIVLRKCLAETYKNYDMKLGRKRIIYLIKNATDLVKNKPQLFIHLHGSVLKFLHYNFTREEFEELYGNLHPDEDYHFDFMRMLSYLKYYPKEKRLQLMMNKFKQVYGKPLLGNNKSQINMHSVYLMTTTEQFERIYKSYFPKYLYEYNTIRELQRLECYPREHRLNLLTSIFQKIFRVSLLDDTERIATDELLKLLSDREREKQARRLIEKCKSEYTQEYFKWACYLPVRESFEIFKNMVRVSKRKQRIDFIKKMIYTCKVFNDQKHLLLVLNYYNRRFKNEKPRVLNQILDYLIDQFDVTSLDNSNWMVFCEIVQRAYVKDQLFNAPDKVVNNIFDGALHRSFIQSTEETVVKEHEISLDAFVNMYLEYKIEFRPGEWYALKNYPEIEIKFIEKLFCTIPQLYPDEHLVWKQDDKKIAVLIKLFNKMYDYNSSLKQRAKTNGLKEDDIKDKLIRVQSSAWLMKSTIDILTTDHTGNSTFKNTVKKFDSEFYLSLIPDVPPAPPSPHQNLKSGKAVYMLKNEQGVILQNWEEYLSAARQPLRCNSEKGARAAKLFILSTKWHDLLPFKFVERCLLEIKEIGSLAVLGLLLEGEVLSKVISAYLPTGPAVNVYEKNSRERFRITSSIPAALNATMPPVSSESLLPLFQGEFVHLGRRSVKNFGRRAEKTKVLMLAKQLMNLSASVKRDGARLVLEVASTEELQEFLKLIWNDKNYHSVCGLIARKIFRRFIRYPNDKTYALVNTCVTELKRNDRGALKILTDTSLIIREYAPPYIENLLGKIEELSENDCMELEWKEKWVKIIFGRVKTDVIYSLPKKMIFTIIRKYFFNAESRAVCTSAQNFGEKVFSRPFDPVVTA